MSYGYVWAEYGNSGIVNAVVEGLLPSTRDDATYIQYIRALSHSQRINVSTFESSIHISECAKCHMISGTSISLHDKLGQTAAYFSQNIIVIIMPVTPECEY